MNNKAKNFICSNDNSCQQKIGYTKYEIERILFIIFSTLGVITNFIFILYNLVKNKTKTRKASMRRIFLIFPLTDLLTAIYWLISALNFYNLEQIQNKPKGCSFLSCYFMHVNVFQLTFINALLFHFRKINTNPIEGILKPNKNILKYFLTCSILGALVTGLSEGFSLLGRSPLNTCFINTKNPGYFGYIYLIPVISIIIAIIQLIHDLFFKTMFNSDKKIRRIHRKNSCFVLIFCLFHIPLIVAILISFLLKENNFADNKYRIFLIIITYLLCLTPLLMSIIRQIQGLSRFECVHDYIKKKKQLNLLSGNRSLSTYRRYTTNKDDPSLASDLFEWLENHVMEYFMRDILLGVAASLKRSKQYENNIENMELNQQDYGKYSKFEINFDNYKEYDLNDDTVEKSEYLNIRVIDYAPKCFYYLRNLEKIYIDNMIESFLPKNNKQGIKKSQGKSGSFFISTDDNKYMIKTLKSDELELLKHAFLKEYIEHIKNNPRSLLCRLYGMYNIILGQGDEVLIIVMRNVIGDFKDNTIVKFDLKGSTYKRTANFDMVDNNNVLKDLDFIEFEKSIMLSKSSITKLRETTKKDSQFLCNSDLMDYSLFLVKLTLNKQEAEDVFGDNITEKQNNDFIQIISDENENCNIDILRKTNSYRGNGIIHDVEHYRQYLFPSLTQGTAYIISIIDYFQIFNFFKYVESSLKTNFFRQKKKKIISCVDPETYSNRFIKYITSLTDVKQFLSNEIQEAPKEKEEEKYFDEDDSDDENKIINKIYKKISSSFENKQYENSELLLPIDMDVSTGIQTYTGPKVDLKDY